MIGGITANMYCSNLFEKGTDNFRMYNIPKDAKLSADALYALTVSFIQIEKESPAMLDQSGSHLYKTTFTELHNAYIKEMETAFELEDGDIQIPFVEYNKSSDNVIPSSEDITNYELIGIAGAMMTGAHFDVNNSELQLAIEAQRAVEVFSHKKHVIEMGITMAFLYSHIRHIDKGINVKKRKEMIKEILYAYTESITNGDVKPHAYFSFSGISRGNIPHVLNATLTSVYEAKDFEDSIKMAGSCIFYTAFTSFVAGILAEEVFSVPEDFCNTSYTMLTNSEMLYDALTEYQKKFPPNMGKKRNFFVRNW